MNHEPLRAPAENRTALISPDIHELSRVVSENRTKAREMDFIIAGRRGDELRGSLRKAVLNLARATTQKLGAESTPEAAPETPVVMTGHQPEIFHPGVWFKHHLTDQLARATGGVGLNLVLETDLPDLLGLTVPVRVGDEAKPGFFSYAPMKTGRTWEEHTPDGSWRVETFIAEVMSAMPMKAEQTFFPEFARGMREAQGVASNAAELVTQARFGVERSAELGNMEVFASEICQTREFMLFTLAIVSDLDRFRKSYNEALRAYREEHRVRGKANPIPGLEPDEAPFWVYAKGGARRPLTVKRTDDGIALLMDETEVFAVDEPTLAGMRTGKREAFDEATDTLLKETSARELRIRTRALTTTMLLRMFVADVFIHGIGGAKYDAITDRIIRDYFGMTPPGFITASATMHLPMATLPGTNEDVRRLKRLLREMEFSPDQHVPAEAAHSTEVSRLVRRKRELLARHRGETRAQRHEVFEDIREVDAKLNALIGSGVESTRRELERVEREVASNRIIRGREYAFVLFGREDLLGFYKEALAGLR